MVDVLKNAKFDGLEDGKRYLFGGRSFSIWDAATMQQVFDSGSDFEKNTAEKYSKYFNSSNKDTVIDSRSRAVSVRKIFQTYLHKIFCALLTKKRSV
jgi:hypothetical protein